MTTSQLMRHRTALAEAKYELKELHDEFEAAYAAGDVPEGMAERGGRSHPEGAA